MSEPYDPHLPDMPPLIDDVILPEQFNAEAEEIRRCRANQANKLTKTLLVIGCAMTCAISAVRADTLAPSVSCNPTLLKPHSEFYIVSSGSGQESGPQYNKVSLIGMRFYGGKLYTLFLFPDYPGVQCVTRNTNIQ